MAQYSKDTFIDVIGDLLGWAKSDITRYSPMLEELWNAYDTTYKNEMIDLELIPQLVVGKKVNGKELTPLFNKEFAGYLNLVANPEVNVGIKTLTEYINARDGYTRVFEAYGLKDLATNENIDSFLVGNVSAQEAADRMEVAYRAINNADSILKQQLGSLGLTDRDLAKALLTGKEGALELESKIRQANVLAAQVESGITSAIGTNDLAKNLSLSRGQIAAGLAQTKQQLGAYEAASSRIGEDVAGIQSELEKENLLGMASTRRARLAAQETNLFTGQSGIAAQVSKKKQTPGLI